MKPTLVLSVLSAALGAAALGVAASAHADPEPLNGTYEVAWPTENRFDTWSFTGTCATAGCTATRDNGDVFTLTDGKWVNPNRGHGACGAEVPSEYSILAGGTNMLGVMKVFWDGQCGNTGVTSFPFSLSKK